MRPNYVVAVYLCDKAYGGPEEGGWWYDTGEWVKTTRFAFPREDEAYVYARRMQRLLDRTLNKGRREISSVLSEGRYYAEVHDGAPPKHYPATRPHYE